MTTRKPFKIFGIINTNLPTSLRPFSFIFNFITLPKSRTYWSFSVLYGIYLMGKAYGFRNLLSSDNINTRTCDAAVLFFLNRFLRNWSTYRSLTIAVACRNNLLVRVVGLREASTVLVLRDWACWRRVWCTTTSQLAFFKDCSDVLLLLYFFL